MKTPEETAKEANRHHDWAGPKKPSMKRRCNQHDYRDRGIYIMTLCLEGRLFTSTLATHICNNK